MTMSGIRPRGDSAALMLNATYEPLGVVSVRRAVILVLSGKAVCVQDGDGILHSERERLPVPLVVRLTRYVRVPYRSHVGLSRRAIFARDGGRCAYCRGPAETIDHVMPRSRGGRHAWENVVAACAHCNHTKGDKTPAELGWRLHVSPAAPRGAAWRVLGHRAPDPRWSDWLDLAEPTHLSSAA
jgi:5-methylcytosine-specific restriction endonuclease McrA